MICRFCGVELIDGTVICPNCGNSLENIQDAVPVAETEAVDPGKTFGLISMILGIVGLALGSVCSCILACLGGALPFAASIAGLILGILGMKKSKEAGFENKKAKIGMILSVVAMVIVVVFIIINAIAGGILAANDYFSYNF